MIRNARIVCKNARPADYLLQEVERGHPDYVISSSSLRDFAFCPSRWRAGYTQRDSKATIYGSLLDCLLLTPEQFDSRYAVAPEVYETEGMRCPKCGSVTNAASCRACGVKRERVVIQKAWSLRSTHCQEWQQEQEEAGRTPVGSALADGAKRAKARLLEDEVIAAWHEASDRQVWISAEWHDPATGLAIPCRCLLDYVPRADTEFCKSAGDLKTTRCAQQSVFSRFAFDRGYHLQAAFGLDMLSAATGEDRNTWCFVLSENYEPYEPNRAMFGCEGGVGQPGFLDLGRNAEFGGYQALLAYYAQCLKSGQWPGYNSKNTVQGWCVLYPEPYMAGRLWVPPATEETPAPVEDPDEPPDFDIVP